MEGEGAKQKKRPPAIYERGLTKEQRKQWRQARKAEGLEHEITMLRVKLNEELAKEETDMRAIESAVRALVSAVSAEHRMSPKARKDLADHAAAFLNSIGDQLLPFGR